MKKIAEGDVFGSDDMISLFGIEHWFEDEDADEDAKIAEEKFSASGIKSFNNSKNLLIYYVAAGVFILVILVMLLLTLVKKFKRPIIKKLRQTKRGFMWNGFIRA